MRRYEVIAHNTAGVSENRIHDDEVARQFGFSGGLVPGVDVYAYLTHPVLEAWGTGWLADGTAEVRFPAPVYDGHATIVDPETSDDGSVVVRASDETGAECATARFALATAAGTVRPSADEWPIVPQREIRPPATSGAFEAFGAGAGLPTTYVTLDPEGNRLYLDAVRESLPLMAGTDAPAHPGWLLRRANEALMAAVTLGPWIHVGSTVRNHAIVRVGDTVETRARLVRWWEAKGHHFVELDVALIVDSLVCITIDHTAIYRPRGTPDRSVSQRPRN